MPSAERCEILSQLVGFDTTSHKSNLALLDYVEAYLSQYGITATRIYNSDKTKANLHAIIGPMVDNGLILSGHTDVVPARAQEWDSDPFKLHQRGNCLYGRGATDMKGFLAIALEKVPDIQAANLPLPIHLAFSYDEEIGCVGAPSLIEHIVKYSPRPSAAIIGEPTSGTVIGSHKAMHVYRTRITGAAGHSSQPGRGANAIVAAAKIIEFINTLSHDRSVDGPLDNRFEPEHTTFNIGEIKGGCAVNIIAEDCHFDWEFRTLPNDDPAKIIQVLDSYIEHTLPGLKQKFGACAPIQVENTKLRSVPALAFANGSTAEQLALHITRTETSAAVSYGTEAGQFQSAGISSIVCGPGSIQQAHKSNEYIEICELDRYSDILGRLIMHLASHKAGSIDHLYPT